MIDKLIQNDTTRYWLKTIMFPTTYSQYTIINLLRLISPRSKFLLQKTILMTIGVSLLHYLLWPIFILYKTYAEKIEIPNLLNNRKIFTGTVNTVCIYSPWFDKFAGGSEAVSAYIAQYFEMKYPDSIITILCDDYLGNKILKPAEREQINQKYGTTLKKTKSILVKHGFLNLFMYKYYISLLKTSMKYDIFINSFMDINPSNSAINIHYIHFPGDVNDAVSKYLFNIYRNGIDSYIANSTYTSFWTKKVLDIKDVAVVEPPVVTISDEIYAYKSKVIVTAGRISVEKNLEFLINTFIDSIQKWPDWEYHIIGSKNPNNIEYFNQLERMSKGFPIKFFTNLTKDDFNSYLKKAQIYWHGMGYGVDLQTFPGQTEHFGMTVVEAMSFGCVPVVFNVGGPADVVCENKCGFLWATPGELVNSTIKLIEDKELYKSMSKLSHFSSAKYSVENFMKKFGEEADKTFIKVKEKI